MDAHAFEALVDSQLALLRKRPEPGGNAPPRGLVAATLAALLEGYAAGVTKAILGSDALRALSRHVPNPLADRPGPTTFELIDVRDGALILRLPGRDGGLVRHVPGERLQQLLPTGLLSPGRRLVVVGSFLVDAVAQPPAADGLTGGHTQASTRTATPPSQPKEAKVKKQLLLPNGGAFALILDPSRSIADLQIVEGVARGDVGEPLLLTHLRAATFGRVSESAHSVVTLDGTAGGMGRWLSRLQLLPAAEGAGAGAEFQIWDQDGLDLRQVARVGTRVAIFGPEGGNGDASLPRVLTYGARSVLAIVSDDGAAQGDGGPGGGGGHEGGGVDGGGGVVVAGRLVASPAWHTPEPGCRPLLTLQLEVPCGGAATAGGGSIRGVRAVTVRLSAERSLHPTPNDASASSAFDGPFALRSLRPGHHVLVTGLWAAGVDGGGVNGCGVKSQPPTELKGHLANTTSAGGAGAAASSPPATADTDATASFTASIHSLSRLPCVLRSPQLRSLLPLGSSDDAAVLAFSSRAAIVSWRETEPAGHHHQVAGQDQGREDTEGRECVVGGAVAPCGEPAGLWLQLDDGMHRLVCWAELETVRRLAGLGAIELERMQPPDRHAAMLGLLTTERVWALTRRPEAPLQPEGERARTAGGWWQVGAVAEAEFDAG